MRWSLPSGRHFPIISFNKSPPFGPPLSFVEWASAGCHPHNEPNQPKRLQLHPHSTQKIQLAVKSTDNIVRSDSTLCLYIISKQALSRNKILIIHRQRLETTLKSSDWFKGVWADIRCKLQNVEQKIIVNVIRTAFFALLFVSRFERIAHSQYWSRFLISQFCVRSQLTLVISVNYVHEK